VSESEVAIQDFTLLTQHLLPSNYEVRRYDIMTRMRTSFHEKNGNYSLSNLFYRFCLKISSQFGLPASFKSPSQSRT
jgi:hypothetical protein